MAESIEIEDLDPTALPSLEHRIPAQKDGLTVYLSVEQIVDLAVAGAIEQFPSGGNNTVSVTQESHGFSVGNYAERQEDGTWDDSLSEHDAMRGVVTAVDGDDFEVTIFGIVTGLTISGTEAFGDPIYATTGSALTTTFTGFEMGTALATSEMFVNPRFWPIGSIIQDYGKTIVPSSAQTLTTTFADVTEVTKSFTPKGGASKTEVIAALTIHQASETASDQLISHLRLMKDAVECTKSEATTAVLAVSESELHYVHGQASWGQGTAQTLKVQAKEYSASYDTKLFETRLADGTTASELKNAHFRVYERRVA